VRVIPSLPTLFRARLILGLERDLSSAELNRSRLESDVRQLTRERADMSDQLSAAIRQKNGASEELVRLRHEVDQHVVNVDQLSKDKEALMSDKAQLTVHVATAERQSQQLNDVRDLLHLRLNFTLHY